MAVTEAMMSLFLKEQVLPDRVSAAIERMDVLVAEEDRAERKADAGKASKDPEESLLCWADTCLRVLKGQARKEKEVGANRVAAILTVVL